jgi:hypothetical protein
MIWPPDHLSLTHLNHPPVLTILAWPEMTHKGRSSRAIWIPRTAGIGATSLFHQSADEGRVAALLRTSIIAACTTYALTRTYA